MGRVTRLRGGVHYPRSVGEFQAWFRTDADCLDYLEWVRWPQGFVCPDCGPSGGWRLGDGRIMCAACGHRTSVTAGTIFDRTRTPLTDWSSASRHPFVTSHVEPGAKVITDAWMGYHGLEGLGYVHERRSQRAARARGDDPGELLPAVHRVASLAKRWLLSTHQGSVDEAHLQSYLDEFVFRFNRRRSRSPRLVSYPQLELAPTPHPF